MALWHVPDMGGPSRLATTVEVADSAYRKAKGLMFRRSFPEGTALVFPFDRASIRSVHMLFVRFPIDVVWLVEEEVTAVRQLRAWADLAWARGDTIVELPAGGADGVEPGDRIVRSSEPPSGGR